MMSVKLMRLSRIETEEPTMINSLISSIHSRMQIKYFNVFTINMVWRMSKRKSFLRIITPNERKTTMMCLKFQETPHFNKLKSHFADWPSSTIPKTIQVTKKPNANLLKLVKLSTL